MFSYEANGKIQGLLLSYDGIYNYELSAYSVEKAEFKKELMKRRFIGSGIILALISVPSILIPIGENLTELGIFLAIASAFILFLGGLDELIKLFKKDSVLFKCSNGYGAGYAYPLQNTDQNKIYQRVFSKIFADNGNTMFWFKIFNMKNENLLREATEIMISEKKLREALGKLNHHRNHIARSETTINTLEQMTHDDLLILEEKFKEFRDEVMETKIDHDLGIDEIMEMVVKARS